jgi:hypothetical protein
MSDLCWLGAQTGDRNLVAVFVSAALEVWTRRGLQRFIVLFFIELSTCKVEVVGIASAANGLWMLQIGRNGTDAVDGILNGKRYLIHDRDPAEGRFCFRVILIRYGLRGKDAAHHCVRRHHRTVRDCSG